MSDSLGSRTDDDADFVLRCHYTPTDLICTSKLGVTLIVRNYRDVFAAEGDLSGRQKRVVENTIWLGLGSEVKLLATHKTRVAMVVRYPATTVLLRR